MAGYTTINDANKLVEVQQNSSGTSKMYCSKSLLRLHRYSDRIDLIHSDNNLIVGTWGVTEATEYKGGITQLSDYILSLLNT